jgi:phage terminase large subunit
MSYLYSHVCIKDDTNNKFLDEYVIRQELEKKEFDRRLFNIVFLGELKHLKTIVDNIYQREYAKQDQTPEILTAIRFGNHTTAFEIELRHLNQHITICISSVIKNF